MFSHQKKSGPWNFGKMIFFPSLPFPTPLGLRPIFPGDPFDLVKGGSRDETAKVANLED